MKILRHHIYEYKKGLRNLVLHTVDIKYKEEIVRKLKKEKIDYIIYPINGNSINVFLGATEAVAVIRQIGKSSLRNYSPEEDFMLGVMLGYDRRIQCERYLKMVKRQRVRDMKMYLDKTSICVV